MKVDERVGVEVVEKDDGAVGGGVAVEWTDGALKYPNGYCVRQRSLRWDDG